MSLSAILALITNAIPMIGNLSHVSDLITAITNVIKTIVDDIASIKADIEKLKSASGVETPPENAAQMAVSASVDTSSPVVSAPVPSPAAAAQATGGASVSDASSEQAP